MSVNEFMCSTETHSHVLYMYTHTHCEAPLTRQDVFKAILLLVHRQLTAFSRVRVVFLVRHRLALERLLSETKHSTVWPWAIPARWELTTNSLVNTLSASSSSFFMVSHLSKNDFNMPSMSLMIPNQFVQQNAFATLASAVTQRGVADTQNVTAHKQRMHGQWDPAVTDW